LIYNITLPSSLIPFKLENLSIAHTPPMKSSS
jgi:hypothetical protein